MATTTEYALLLLASFMYKNVPVKYLDITKDFFILFDGNKSELFRASRNPGNAISTQRFAGLSYGISLSFLPSQGRLFALSGDVGAEEIECKQLKTES